MFFRRFCSTTARGLFAQVRNQGYGAAEERVPKSLTGPLLQNLKDHFEGKKSSFEVKVLRLFSNVYTSKQRYSLPIPLSPQVWETMKYICRKNDAEATCGHFLEQLVGPDGELVELSVLISLPGSQPQADHSDLSYPQGTLEGDIPRICSIFVALQDIEANMGPTKIYPKTHTREFHSQIEKKSYTYSTDGDLEMDQVERDSNAQNYMNNISNQFIEMVVEEGTIYTIDSRVIHSGGGNSSKVPRYVLCFAFQRRERGSKRAERADGFTYHIEKDVKDRNLSLKDFW